VQREQIWYPPLPDLYQPFESRLEVLGQSLLGTQRLSSEVFLTPVPDIEMEHLHFGEARLIDCLFTSRRW
jgi:hypothetical protein